MNAMNDALQSVLQAHYLDPWDSVILEELSRRVDQSKGKAIRGRRRLDVHGPVSTRVSSRIPHFILQEPWKVLHIPVHHEVRQIAGIWLQLLQQLQTPQRHIPMVNGRVDEEPWVRTTISVL